MIDAALYLAGRSLVNGLRRRLRRLRQPKYMIGFAVGLLYYYAFFLRPRGGGQSSAAPLPGAAAEVVAMLGLVVLIVTGWLFGSSRSPLVYTPAETHFLFTAPLTRRQVLDFKLLRSQLALGHRELPRTSEDELPHRGQPIRQAERRQKALPLRLRRRRCLGSEASGPRR